MKKVLMVSILSLLAIGIVQPCNNVSTQDNVVTGFEEIADDSLNLWDE